MERRSFITSVVSLVARGLALLGGTVALAGCAQPVKYGGPPIEPQPTKYGGPPVPPGVYPKYGVPTSQPSSQPAPKVKAVQKYGGRPPQGG
jgi:hypothetical protein